MRSANRGKADLAHYLASWLHSTLLLSSITSKNIPITYYWLTSCLMLSTEATLVE